MVDIDTNKMKELLKNYQHLTMQEMTNIFSISKNRSHQLNFLCHFVVYI